MQEKDLLNLMHKLGYRFKDVRILERALDKNRNKGVAKIGDGLINRWAKSKIDGYFGSRKKFRGLHKQQYYNCLISNRNLYSLAVELGLVALCHINESSNPRNKWHKAGDTIEAIYAGIYDDCGDIGKVNNLLDRNFSDLLIPLETALRKLHY